MSSKNLIKMVVRYTAYVSIYVDSTSKETAGDVTEDRNKIIWKDIADRFDAMCFFVSN